MTRLGKAIRRHQETTRRERELARAFRYATGSDMRAELEHLTHYSDLR